MDIAQDFSSVHSGSTYGYADSVNIESKLPEVFQGSGSFSDFGEFFTLPSGRNEPLNFVKLINGRVAGIQDVVLDIFDLAMNDLAQACHVTRKTLYNWRKSEREINRRKKGIDRLFTLSEVARNWRNAGYVKPGDFLREPLLNGASLFDLLVADAIDQEAIQFLGARLTMSQLDTFDVSNPFA